MLWKAVYSLTVVCQACADVLEVMSLGTREVGENILVNKHSPPSALLTWRLSIALHIQLLTSNLYPDPPSIW